MRMGLTGRFAMAQAIMWTVRVLWADEAGFQGTSSLTGSIGAPPSHVLRGDAASAIELTLVPAVYQNHVNATLAKGYRLQYERSAVGDSAAPSAFHDAPGALGVRVVLRPTVQQFTITVDTLQVSLLLMASDGV